MVYGQPQLSEYKSQKAPDGEIIFLAAKPDSGRKGIGTMLLEELKRRENGKEIFLYTDSGCTYQFYEHRGFAREAQREVVLELGGKNISLECYLYAKEI